MHRKAHAMSPKLEANLFPRQMCCQRRRVLDFLGILTSLFNGMFKLRGQEVQEHSV